MAAQAVAASVAQRSPLVCPRAREYARARQCEVTLEGKRSEEEGLLRRYLGYFETAGTLYRNGLFSGDLMFDWMAVTTAWDRVKGYALGVREEAGDPRLFENFEYAAEQARAWQPTRDVALGALRTRRG